MKSSIKYLTIAVVAVGVGLLGGYFLFSGGSQPGTTETAAPASEAAEEIWTCSMHPQIRQNEPGLCPICEMDLIPLGQNTSNDPLVLEMTSEAVKLAQVQTTIIGENTVSAGVLRMNGKVQEDERRAASLVAHVPGRIDKLYVTFKGERVGSGQKLATLYSPDLIMAQRELLEALAYADVNPGLAEAARKKLRFWKISDEQITDIEESGAIRETFDVYAEASGYVTARHVSVGDYVRQGEILFEIVNYNRVWVLFDAYEEDLARIQVGNKVTFTTPALPERKFETRITYIDPAINPQTRVASVRAEINNTRGLLKPEMFVRGTLTASGTSDKELMVPKSAVLWTGRRSVVYVKKPDTDVPSFEYHEVELGDAAGNSYVILSGLEAGDEVVTNGNFAIDAAAQLNNQQSMMNKVVKVKGAPEPAVPDYGSSAPVAFKQQLETVTATYAGLKDALVQTNPEEAATAANAMTSALEKVDMTLVAGDAHTFWMQQMTGLSSHLDNIAQEKDIEEQREQFGFVSDLMIETLRSFGTAGQTVFVQHCPMAFDNEGADWLSFEKPIRNPYFGDKMLKCGKVTDSLTLTAATNSQQFHNH